MLLDSMMLDTILLTYLFLREWAPFVSRPEVVRGD